MSETHCDYCGFEVTAERERDELRAEVERLRDAGAVLLRAVYASGIAYRDTEIAAALAAFARL